MTSWNNQIQLSPDQQAALNQQMQLQSQRTDTASGLMGQVDQSMGTPMDWNSFSPGATAVQAGQRQQMNQAPGQIQTSMDSTAGDWRQRAQEATWKMQEPMMQQRRSALETQLTNQGFARGSAAWDAEMMKLGDQENRDRLGAIGAGREEANMLFNQDLAGSQFQNTAQQQQYNQELARLGFNNNVQGQNLSDQIAAGNFNQQLRQQDIAEGQMQRSQPLNDMNALLYGQQVQNPQMPTFTNATRGESPQYLNAAGMTYQSDLDRYNASQMNQAGMMSGLFSLGGAAMNNGGWGGLFNFSDERLKKDIKKLFTLPNGVEVYSYKFKNMTNTVMGVLAQQVLKVMPEAVSRGPDGFYRVNYEMVLK